MKDINEAASRLVAVPQLKPAKAMPLKYASRSEIEEEKEKYIMPVKNPEEIFVRLLSHARQGTERTATILQELGEAAQNPEIKDALQARAFVSQKTLATIDEAFKQIGKKPVTLTGRLHDVFVEDFRKELGEIQSPMAKRLFVLAKAHQLINLRIAEYAVMIAAADVSGHYGVGVLLESCLADLLAFTERARRLIRNVVEERIEARAAGASS